MKHTKPGNMERTPLTLEGVKKKINVLQRYAIQLDQLREGYY